MDSLGIIFGIGAVIGLAFLVWTYTTKGKKWLESL